MDLSILKRSWEYSKADFAAVLATILITLAIGVEAGVSAGLGLSILLHLYKSSKPHIADEFEALLPWLNHFCKRLNKADDPERFIQLVSQLQLILTQIDCIHEYDFAAYKLLLSMAGDFSPLLNHLNKRTKRVSLH